MAASILSSHDVCAQTPMDFMPGSLVKLGVQFNSVNIDPPGSFVDSLTRKYALAIGYLGSANNSTRSSN